LRVLRFAPAKLSLMMRKSSPATCVNCGLPAQSPMAQTLGAVVSNRSLTRIYPRASNPTPAFSSPMSCVFGTRPAATRMSLPGHAAATPEARRLVERFEWHYTPKHGSWLDLAESELGVLSLWDSTQARS
jgi:hypothetical protein